MNKLLLVSLATVTLLAPPAFSKGIPLEQATITRTINDVRVIDPGKGSAPAHVSQVIKDDMGVKTGVKSRAELLFQDNTLTRLGAESYFTFRPGTREMSLDSGTLLLQVPKDHGGATIRSASITASITGTTILIETVPNKSVKVLVLEGSLRLSMNDRLGEAIALHAGKMIILHPGAKNLPDPVNVDLRRVIKTSSLINPDLFSSSAKTKPALLPSMPLIAAAIAEQDKQHNAGKLQETNLVILGKGTKVIAASEKTMKILAAATFPAASGAVINDSQGNAGTASNGSAATVPDAATASGTFTQNTAGGGSTASGQSSSPLGIFGASASGGTALQNLSSAISASATAAPGNSGAAASFGAPGSPVVGDVDINNPVLQSSGTIRSGGAPSGAGGTFSAVATGRVRVTSSIEVSSNSPTRKSASGGTIRLESLQTGGGRNGIEIANTAQLLSLLNSAAPGAGGLIEFVSAGSKILIGGKIEADRGTITVTNNGAGGQIQIQNADLAANVIKVCAVQPNGVLTIGGSHISANNLLRLYGGSGTGGVFFTGNTVLDGSGLKQIAGKEVQIASGKVVSLAGGFTTVFTDKASYAAASGGNGTTTGRFELKALPGVPIPVFRLPYSFRP